MCPRIAYATKREAKRALRSCREQAESGMECRAEQRVYRCPYCACFHLTSMSVEEFEAQQAVRA